MSVVVARPPKSAVVVGVIVDLELDVDPVEATKRIHEAAELLRAAGMALVLLPPSVEMKPRRRRWRRTERKKR